MEKFDIIHLHWPENMLRDKSRPLLVNLFLLITGLSISAIRGSKLILTYHNHGHHDSNNIIDRLFRRFIIKMSSGIIFLSQNSRISHENIIKAEEKNNIVLEHGHYGEIYNPVERIKDSVVNLAFFGQIRRYKGIEILIDACKDIDFPASLQIIGSCNDLDYLEELKRRSVMLSIPVCFRIGFVEEKDLSKILSATDLIVYPFKNILNSGSIFIGPSIGIKALVPNLDSIQELISQVGRPWFYSFDDVLTAAEIKEAVYGEDVVAPYDFTGTAYDWHIITAKLDMYFEEIVKL